MRDHIKIAHHQLLVPPPPAATAPAPTGPAPDMVLVDDLGPDQDEAMAEFRALLQDLGET